MVTKYLSIALVELMILDCLALLKSVEVVPI